MYMILIIHFESDFLGPIDKLRETDLNDIMKKGH